MIFVGKNELFSPFATYRYNNFLLESEKSTQLVAATHYDGVKKKMDEFGFITSKKTHIERGLVANMLNNADVNHDHIRMAGECVWLFYFVRQD
jgi:hypothetical protein